MCLYCQYDHTFWEQVVAGAQRIRILTDDEVEQLYRDNPQLRPGNDTDGAGE